MGNLSRRKFIKITAVASASLSPVAAVLAEYFGVGVNEVEKALSGKAESDPQFHLIGNNLINLHFYFLNVRRKRGVLRPTEPTRNSFMIVRLPQQHVSEAGFWSDSWDKPAKNKPFAMLSGFSFLAFRIWPNTPSSDKRHLEFSLETILDWNNQSSFKLITLVDWLDLRQPGATFKFADLVSDCAGFKQKKIWVRQPQAGVFARYQSIVTQLFENNANVVGNSFVPITFFEVPHEVCLVPLLRTDKNNPGRARFWPNRILEPTSHKTENRKYEIWSNNLFYDRPKPGAVSPDKPTEQQFVFETPVFRIAGLITDRDFSCPHPAPQPPAGQCPEPIECSVDSTQPRASDILPTLLDKAELAYLTQFATDNLAQNRVVEDFDIKELNGFFFTGLGVITHLKYDTQKSLPCGIDLIEYEHRIAQGRDVFIKVARLGYNSKTGQKYKHVIEGKRKIQTEAPITAQDPPLASFIELKQYCECIEPAISYAELDDRWDKQDFVKHRNSLSPIDAPIVGKTAHFRRIPFRSLEITDKKRIPINCLQDTVIDNDVCRLENLFWFWVVREGPTKNSNGTPIQDVDVPIERYLPCHYDAMDWEGARHQAATPFMFVRKSYIEAVAAHQQDPEATGGAYKNYLRGVYHVAQLDPRVERKRTYFNGDKLAFTGLPNRVDTTLPNYDSKTNILETDYFESYFNLKNTNYAQDPDAGKPSFGEKRYVVFPQVLRARVFLDHIRDIAQRKIASVVEYHRDYIEGGFDQTLGGTQIKNFGKLILNHTAAYTQGLEEPINQTYGVVKTALQQAKDKLGNLALPDIIPDAISLDPSGITLPPDMRDTINKGRATYDQIQNKLASLNPRALLRGKVSEILGGIDLVAILDELIPQDNSPLFELKKLANELEKIENVVINSDVYKQILADLENIDHLRQDIVAKAARIKKLLDDIKQAQADVNAALQNLSNLIPNVDELDSIIKKLFEQYRTRAFQVLLENVKFGLVEDIVKKAKADVKAFLDREIQILKLEFNARLNELWDSTRGRLIYFDDIADDLRNLPSELRLIGGKDPATYFDSEIRKAYESATNGSLYVNGRVKTVQQAIDDLFRTVTDNALIKVGTSADDVYYKVRSPRSWPIDGFTTPIKDVIEWELTKRVPGAEQLFNLNGSSLGYVQLQKKIGDFRNLVAGNLESADAFKKDAVAKLSTLLAAHEQSLVPIQKEVEAFDSELKRIAKDLRDWNDLAEQVRQRVNDPLVTPEIKEAVKRVQELIVKGNAYVDFLRKADPYFYYTEQERLRKDVQDVKRRFLGALAALWGPLEEFPPCPATGVCSKPGDFRTITESVHECICAYECVRKKLQDYATNLNPDDLKNYVAEFNDKVKTPLDDIKSAVIKRIDQNLQQYPQLAEAYHAVERARDQLKSFQNDYEQVYREYLKQVGSQAAAARKTITDRVQEYITNWEQQLANEVDPAVVRELEAKINEARNVYRALTSIKQQDLTYKWSTTNFHDVNLGILTFKKGSNPDTKLKVDVRITTHFSPGKFPPAIERVETLSENRLTNFGVGFFNVLTLSFSEVSFRAASGQSPHFGVKIKDVKFDGSFSFVQAFEKFMAGKGLILRLEADRLILGYSLPLPSIQTPSFAFFNLSLNFDIRLYFDNRPMRFGFSFARPDLKFGIAAGIYAGFGFFGLVGEPKRGIIEMDAALEAGAWKGISIGPISGEVKLAFGFRYTRNDSGVRLEGYIVAEGRLSVWIIEVSARIYLGVVSENSYVEGQCTVTYSAKLGFVSKSFSGTFHQKIAGSKSNNNDENARALLAYLQTMSALLDKSRLPDITARSSDLYSGYIAFLTSPGAQQPEIETYPVSRKAWKKFARIM